MDVNVALRLPQHVKEEELVRRQLGASTSDRLPNGAQQIESESEAATELEVEQSESSDNEEQEEARALPVSRASCYVRVVSSVQIVCKANFNVKTIDCSSCSS